LEAFKNNPSVIGFTAEQILISHVATYGLHTPKLSLDRAEIVVFAGNVPQLSTSLGSKLYVPLKFNLKAVDAVYVKISAKMKAQVIPIQIATGAHERTEPKFFSAWDRWVEPIKDFAIDVTFLWIYGGKRGQADTEAKEITLRGRKIPVCPDYATCWVSIIQVHPELGKKLKSIRPKSSRNKPRGKSEGVEDEGVEDEGVVGSGDESANEAPVDKGARDKGKGPEGGAKGRRKKVKGLPVSRTDEPREGEGVGDEKVGGASGDKGKEPAKRVQRKPKGVPVSQTDEASGSGSGRLGGE
jgi:hypothetical protein